MGSSTSRPVSDTNYPSPALVGLAAVFGPYSRCNPFPVTSHKSYPENITEANRDAARLKDNLELHVLEELGDSESDDEASHYLDRGPRSYLQDVECQIEPPLLSELQTMPGPLLEELDDPKSDDEEMSLDLETLASHYLDPGPHFSRASLDYLQGVERRIESPLLSDEEEDPQLNRPTISGSLVLVTEIKRICQQMNGMTCEELRVPIYLVVAFVEVVEEACQYFELKKFIREKYNKTMMLGGGESGHQITIDDLMSSSKFIKLDKCAIRHALQDYIVELKYETETELYHKYLLFLVYNNSLHGKSRYIDHEAEIQSQFSDLNSVDLENAFKWYQCSLALSDPLAAMGKEQFVQYLEQLREGRLGLCHKKQELDPMLTWRPIYARVHQTLLSGLCLDKDPESEIQNLRRLGDGWFGYHFLKDAPLENLLYQARTVIVHNVSLDASEQDIKQLWTFGDIESVKMKMKMKSGDKAQTVHVIFKDSQGTESALLVQDPAVLNLPVIIKPRLGSEQREAVYAYLRSSSFQFQSSGVHPIVAVTKLEMARDTYKLALEKYELLRQPILDSNQAFV